MKKSLLGLIITIMMADSGYTKVLNNEICEYFLKRSIETSSIVYYMNKGKHWTEKEDREESEAIERAYRFAVTYNIMCNKE